MKKLCYSFILLVSFLSATIINVPDDYSTIQAGINASDDGDTVLIAQGIYFENLILQKPWSLLEQLHNVLCHDDMSNI